MKLPGTHKIVGYGLEVVVKASKNHGRPKKIQVEGVKVPEQCGRSRKVAKAEISQFKGFSLPKTGNVRKFQK